MTLFTPDNTVKQKSSVQLVREGPCSERRGGVGGQAWSHSYDVELQHLLLTYKLPSKLTMLFIPDVALLCSWCCESFFTLGYGNP